MTRPATELVMLNGTGLGPQWHPTNGHAGTHHARYATLAILGCPEHGLTAEEVRDHWQCRVCKVTLETCYVRGPLP